MQKLEECNKKRRGMEKGENRESGEPGIYCLLISLTENKNYGQWKPVHNDSGVEFLS
jgi:hypothetical protein